MEKELIRTIELAATPSQVWKTLTDSDKIAQYMFGARTHTDWQPGSEVDYYIKQGDMEIVAVQGKVIRVEPVHYLEHTVFPAGAGMENKPENHLTTIYKLATTPFGILLTIIQRDFSAVEAGAQRYEDATRAWEMVLPKIKEVAEQSE